MTRFRHSRSIARGILAVFAGAVFAGTAYAQGAVITGTIKSEQGQPLQGANVYITELNVSVGANEEGVYRITLAAERVRGQSVNLRVRAIGFQPGSKAVTLTAGTHTEDFELKIDVNKLNEVVVTGVTGATETKKLAFTVSKVDAADLPVPATSALQSLQGKITGAQIVQPSGRPGQNPSIILRGPKSLNLGLSPLIIVDGVVMNGDMGDINPQDIESIEVVKGAAASSTYGSRAGNGVIQITTKSGKNAGQGVRFNVRSEYGAQDIQSEYPFAARTMMTQNATQDQFCIKVSGQPACSRSVDFEAEALRVNNVPDPSALAPYNFETDYGIGLAASKPELKGRFQINQWPKRYNPIAQAVTQGPYNNTNVDMTGRFGNTGFFASASNLIQTGAIKFLYGYKRNTARMNLDQQIGEEITMNLSTLYGRNTTYPDGGAFFRLTRVPAGVDLLRRDDFGRLFIRSNPNNQGQQNENPLYDNENIVGADNADRYLGSWTTRYTPFAWLDFDANASLDRRRSSFYQIRDKGFRVTRNAQSSNYLGTLSQSSNLDQAYNFSFQGTARKSAPLGIRDLDTRFNMRYSYEQSDGESLSASGGTLAVPGLYTLRNVTVPNNPNSSTNSVRAMGVLTGIALDYKGKYIVDGIFRRDGSSLFGAAERWHGYYRGSLAWRLSDEGWWPAKGVFDDFKFRVSYGTAGGRPGFAYQYETFNIGNGGTISADQLGNRFLKPEQTAEAEWGVDAELFNKYGLNVTYARDITTDQMLQVPVSASSGFSSQWRNAGTLDNKTWEASMTIPLITNRSVVWTSRVSWDRNRAFITALGVPPFSSTTASARFEFRVGERIGTLYGKYFLTRCTDLPAQFQSDCGGDGKSYQVNDDGILTWTGGYSWKDGVKLNLWQSALPGCLVNGAWVNQTGEVNCQAAGGVVNNPWAIPHLHWGMHINLRDSTGSPVYAKMGNTQPDFRLSFSQNFSWKRLTLYALLDGSYGNRVFNQEIAWSNGDFMVSYEDQAGKTVETAKPLGYYWRGTAPDHGAGVGGIYDVLGSNNINSEKGTYTKVREVSASYLIGPVRGIGDWSVTAVGRNLYTWTDFLGWDPEVGGSVLNSGAVGSTAAYQYPQTRTFTLTLQTRF